MPYYTTVRVVSKDGKAVKAEVTCGGVSRGFTDPNTGEISFDLKFQGSSDVSSKHLGYKASGKVGGGKFVVLRLG